MAHSLPACLWGSERADIHLGHGLAHETVYVDADCSECRKILLQTGRAIRFFEADAAPVVEAPHRCHADRNAALAQQDPDFFKRDIRLCPNQVEQPRGMRLENRATMTAKAARRRSSVKPPLTDPCDRAAGTHRKNLGRRGCRKPARNRTNPPLAQIRRIGPCHRCLRIKTAKPWPRKTPP